MTDVATGNCSWCFKETNHDLVNKGWGVHRSRYQCQKCKKESVTCMKLGCKDMARIVPGMTEKKCYVHRGIIKSWDDKEGIEALNPTRYCSSCFQLSKQKLIIVNYLNGARAYECLSCHEATEKCPKCDEAFAVRGVNECAKCSENIDDWNDVDKNKAGVFIKKTCSWCLNDCNHGPRDQANKIYECVACGGSTKLCPKCDECMMAKSECAKCFVCKSEGPKAWYDFLEAKKANDKKYENWSDKIKEIKRQSEYKEKARGAGVIRPFIILVLMHPRVRAYVAMLLDIVLPIQDDFLDPQGEALIILSHKNGLIARSTTAHEKVLKKSADWYVILYRLMQMYVPQEKCTELPNNTMHPSTAPADDEMVRLELIIINDVLEKQTAILSDVAKQNFEMLKQCKQYEVFSNMLKESKNFKPGMEIYNDVQLLQAFNQVGLHQKEALLTVEEAKQSGILGRYIGIDSRSTGSEDTSDFRTSTYDVANKVSNVAGNVALKSAASVVAPVLGLAVLANNVTTALLGDSLDVCVLPVREIMLYNAVLLARGVEIDDFYYELD